jgi:hypothetical protein
LTPSEWWAWCYLVFLAHEQGSTHVILPRPGEDQEAEKIFSRKHLKRLLKALKAKRHLTNIIFPRSKSKQIEVVLPASRIGDMGVPNMEKGCMGVPNNGPRGTSVSPITTLGTPVSPILQVINATFPNSTPSQAKLKEKLEALTKLKQGDLKGEIQQLPEQVVQQITIMMIAVGARIPRNKRISPHVRLYAMIRFIQEEQLIESPQAWIDTVARQIQREWSKGVSKAAKTAQAEPQAFLRGAGRGPA